MQKPVPSVSTRVHFDPKTQLTQRNSTFPLKPENFITEAGSGEGGLTLSQPMFKLKQTVFSSSLEETSPPQTNARMRANFASESTKPQQINEPMNTLSDDYYYEEEKDLYQQPLPTEAEISARQHVTQLSHRVTPEISSSFEPQQRDLSSFLEKPDLRMAQLQQSEVMIEQTETVRKQDTSQHIKLTICADDSAQQDVTEDARQSATQRESLIKSTEKSQLIGDEYCLLKDLGEGTFGSVKLGKHLPSGQLVAVKILEKRRITDKSDIERVAREMSILKSIRHPHIIKLYEIIETTRRFFLIMEYACGGELFDYIVRKDRLSEQESCRLYIQIISGIEFLHSKGIAHRDLKPENLLLDKKKNLKFVDFGLSNTYKPGEQLDTACGSPCYAAPEMLAGQRYNGLDVDIWSSGVTLYAMLCGFLPFEDPDTALLYKKILKGEFELPDFLSNRSIKFLKEVLCTDPAKRITLEQIKKHPWFRQLDQYSDPELCLGKKNNISLGINLEREACNTQIFGLNSNNITIEQPKANITTLQSQAKSTSRVGGSHGVHVSITAKSLSATATADYTKQMKLKAKHITQQFQQSHNSEDFHDRLHNTTSKSSSIGPSRAEITALSARRALKNVSGGDPFHGKLPSRPSTGLQAKPIVPLKSSFQVIKKQTLMSKKTKHSTTLGLHGSPRPTTNTGNASQASKSKTDAVKSKREQTKVSVKKLDLGGSKTEKSTADRVGESSSLAPKLMIDLAAPSTGGSTDVVKQVTVYSQRQGPSDPQLLVTKDSSSKSALEPKSSTLAMKSLRKQIGDRRGDSQVKSASKTLEDLAHPKAGAMVSRSKKAGGVTKSSVKSVHPYNVMAQHIHAISSQNTSQNLADKHNEVLGFTTGGTKRTFEMLLSHDKRTLNYSSKNFGSSQKMLQRSLHSKLQRSNPWQASRTGGESTKSASADMRQIFASSAENRLTTQQSAHKSPTCSQQNSLVPPEMSSLVRCQKQQAFSPQFQIEPSIVSSATKLRLEKGNSNNYPESIQMLPTQPAKRSRLVQSLEIINHRDSEKTPAMRVYGQALQVDWVTGEQPSNLLLALEILLPQLGVDKVVRKSHYFFEVSLSSDEAGSAGPQCEIELMALKEVPSLTVVRVAELSKEQLQRNQNLVRYSNFCRDLQTILLQNQQ